MTSRYQAKPQTIDGHKFPSKKEAMRYLALKHLERAGEIAGIELQPKFPVLIKGQPYCTYTADFAYFDKRADKLIYEEVKSSGSRKEPAYRLRKKAAELYHGVTITEVVK